MKKFLLLVLIIALPLASFAQPFSVRKAFHKYGHDDGVVKIHLPGIVMDFASCFVDDKPTARMLRGINKIKVIASDKNEGYYGPNIAKEVLDDFRSNRFEEFMTVRNNQDNVSILMKEGRKHRRELLVIAGDKEDSAIIYIKGKITPEMLQTLGKEMEIETLANLKT